MALPYCPLDVENYLLAAQSSHEAVLGFTVVGTYSTPTEIPNVGCSQEETLFSAKQFNCDSSRL